MMQQTGVSFVPYKLLSDAGEIAVYENKKLRENLNLTTELKNERKWIKEHKELFQGFTTKTPDKSKNFWLLKMPAKMKEEITQHLTTSGKTAAIWDMEKKLKKQQEEAAEVGKLRQIADDKRTRQDNKTINKYANISKDRYAQEFSIAERNQDAHIYLMFKVEKRKTEDMTKESRDLIAVSKDRVVGEEVKIEDEMYFAMKRELYRMEVHKGKSHVHTYYDVFPYMPLIIMEDCKDVFSNWIAKKWRPKKDDNKAMQKKRCTVHKVQEDLAWKIMGVQLASAVHYLHHVAGVIHLDITAENVFVFHENIHTAKTDDKNQHRFSSTLNGFITEWGREEDAAAIIDKESKPPPPPWLKLWNFNSGMSLARCKKEGAPVLQHRKDCKAYPYEARGGDVKEGTDSKVLKDANVDHFSLAILLLELVHFPIKYNKEEHYEGLSSLSLLKENNKILLPASWPRDELKQLLGGSLDSSSSSSSPDDGGKGNPEVRESVKAAIANSGGIRPLLEIVLYNTTAEYEEGIPEAFQRLLELWCLAYDFDEACAKLKRQRKNTKIFSNDTKDRIWTL